MTKNKDYWKEINLTSIAEISLNITHIYKKNRPLNEPRNLANSHSTILPSCSKERGRNAVFIKCCWLGTKKA